MPVSSPFVISWKKSMIAYATQKALLRNSIVRNTIDINRGRDEHTEHGEDGVAHVRHRGRRASTAS